MISQHATALGKFYRIRTHKFCTNRPIESIWVFPKLRLNKFVKLVKLAKIFNHWSKLGWELNISLMVSQIGNWAFCSTCASNNHQFHVLPSMTVYFSNWANWVNLTKEGRIKRKLDCFTYTYTDLMNGFGVRQNTDCLVPNIIFSSTGYKAVWKDKRFAFKEIRIVSTIS